MTEDHGLFPDTVYINGTVITMDTRNTKSAAVASMGDKIVAVGSTASMQKLAGPKTQRVDLEGKTLLQISCSGYPW